MLDCEHKQVLQISQVSLFTYGSSMATPAYAQLTHGLRVPYAKNTTILMKEGLEKKNMPFILLLSIIEIAFIHIRLTQLTRKHTPQFCLRILTRLKVLLTQPFDMSNPFCKQSTGVLNAAHLGLLSLLKSLRLIVLGSVDSLRCPRLHEQASNI